MGGYVYIMANRKQGALYIGVTADLARRVREHQQGLVEGFTKRYGIKKLVYAQPHENIEEAIVQEKRMKDWKRVWKIELIEKVNPEWKDLSAVMNV